MDMLNTPGLPMSPPPEAPVPGAGPAVAPQTTASVEVPPPSWLHTNIRHLLLMMMTAALIYLALILRDEKAVAALITLAVVALNHIFVERTALKVPSKDN